jgi:hypothetical protein
MNAKLTIAEIEKRYDKREEIKRAVVLAHSPNRNYVYRRATKLMPKRAALLWIGDMPDIIAAV